jgi:predicted enzyme related to lactoylglutathione lyase
VRAKIANAITEIKTGGTNMSESQGRFVWYELATTDVEAAKQFYCNTVNWGARDAETPGIAYTLFTAGQAPVSGLMELPENARKLGARPGWNGYIEVDDVDAVTDRVKQLGGSVHIPPTDIPNVGRFSIVADPQTAVFALFKWSNHPAEQPPPPGTMGRIGWHELRAADWEKAFGFYSELFGWQKADALNMGEMGIYQLFATDGETIGGMFTKPENMPVPFWLYYFIVGNIDEAVARVKAGGGQILIDPTQVPGGGWIVQGKDPQGAAFALVGTR